ncbi:hypothetical protein [Methylobacterium indicum]|uniref:Uncharacterized protein n=1 Tax=Methylobacterium indicum TaxID=1775910 RepID=A0A8H8WSX2_9HYPH|nr:hypothetical protein [Methylobacterium indicum]BCM83774.1 hypothetical protein mvi_22350 [Methylobacterium indicum]
MTDHRRVRRMRSIATLLVGAVAGLGATTVTVGRAVAQSAASAIDQPTAGTLPPGTSTVESNAGPRDRATGQVAPPSAIQASTDVMRFEGSVQGKDDGGRTDPLKHLPRDRR